MLLLILLFVLIVVIVVVIVALVALLLKLFAKHTGSTQYHLGTCSTIGPIAGSSDNKARA